MTEHTESVRSLSDRLWNGDIDPAEVDIVRLRLTDGEEIAQDILYFKGVSGVTAIDTGEGLVMLDSGTQEDSQLLHSVVRGWRPSAPLRAAVFSHHHIDHVFGVGPFDQEARDRKQAPPVVYGHRLVRENFDRYKLTLGWNTAINLRQFARNAAAFRWPAEYRYPDIEYDDKFSFTMGALNFHLTHARGETDDVTWTWIPERKLLASGDLFIWAVPNAGNPQKVQRYPADWAKALRHLAQLGAEVLVPGHGVPIFGTDKIQLALTDSATLLETIEEQVLTLMNQGAPLDRVLHEVCPPAELLERPYLRPVYDDPQFIVRNIWRLYGGWYDGEPDNLLPAPRAEIAREWIDLAGGIDAVLARVAELLEKEELALACHIVESAAAAYPQSEGVHALRRDAYSRRADGQTSSMARNILKHAALASAENKRDLAGQY